MHVKRNKWYDVIISTVPAPYCALVWVRSSTMILQPFLKDAVNHGMMIDEDWVISRCSHISHYSFLIGFKGIAKPSYTKCNVNLQCEV